MCSINRSAGVSERGKQLKPAESAVGNHVHRKMGLVNAAVTLKRKFFQ